MKFNDYEMLQKLIKLSNENPELEINFFTYYEVVADDWGFWGGKIFKVEKEYVYNDGDRLYFGEDDIKEEFENNMDDSDITDLSSEDMDKLLEKIWNEKIESKEITEQIVAYINN